MYDLEVAICKNEAIGKFEELELGPFLQHPLVQHYFSVSSDTTEVFKINSEEIITLLSKFIDKCKNKVYKVEVDEFLDFISKKRSVSGKEKLGIRIQSLGYVLNFLYLFCYIGIAYKNVLIFSRFDWILCIELN